MEASPHSTPSSWSLLFCVAQHPSPWRLGHYMCIIIIAFHVFFSRRWTSCPVYPGSHTAFYTCGHSKSSVKISSINKWNRKHCCLHMQTNSDLFSMMSFLILFSPYIIFNHVFGFYSSHLQNLWYIMQHLGKFHVILLNPARSHDVAT